MDNSLLLNALGVEIEQEDDIQHYGTPRHSGRYPWGSGDNPQRSKNFRAYVDRLRRKGLGDTEIAKAMGMTTTILRARIASENVVYKLDAINQVQKLKDSGWSNKAIANRLRLSERTVVNYLQPETEAKLRQTTQAVDAIKKIVAERKMVDIGPGAEQQLGISNQKLKNIREQLREEGYTVHAIYENQLSNPGKQTTVLVLAEPGTSTKDIYINRAQIKPISDSMQFSDNGYQPNILRPVELVKSKRVSVNYAEDGGTLQDGVIELRPGVKDLDLGGKSHAQVRIAVEGDRFLKGMAVYSDDLPDGIDIRFNTNKSKVDSDGNPVPKLDVMKKFQKDIDGNVDMTNPFGSSIKPNGQRGALNLVNEEGDWVDWGSKDTLSSQFLSKQSVDLAKSQLDLAYKIREESFKEIQSLTNPTIKKDLLQGFADEMDADAVHLKAAALPRQAVKVILPLPNIKENEIYAPTFHNGEDVALVRYPHGGKFEIADVKVNNNNKQGQRRLGSGNQDAIGIHPAVAQKLSGADFDGDTVIVIPNRKGTKFEIDIEPTRKDLQEFDPRARYSIPSKDLYSIDNPSGIKPMTKRQKGMEMGRVSNLITDMTIKGAEPDEIIRAVKHSMVVIDAEKHKLNWKQSAQDFDIKDLARKYQGKTQGGASTLISKASATVQVPAKVNYIVNPQTGKRVYIDPYTGAKLSSYTGETKTLHKRNSKGEWTEKVVEKRVDSRRMAETDDAFSLSSGTPMESTYAQYANNLKSLANRARLEMLSTPNLEYSPAAAKAYAPEVASLKNKLKIAERNKPYERQATLVSNALLKAKLDSHPNLDSDDIKKLKGMCLQQARAQVGAKKEEIVVSDKEWNAIQAGGISNKMLTDILANTNRDDLVKRALPRSNPLMSTGRITQAKRMLNNGYTMADIADQLGVSVSTLNKAING